MARQTYEEAIRLYLETAGDDELKALVKQLNSLSNGTDAAAGQAEKLVAELEKLATTSNNIRQFTKLKGSVAETATALAAAKERLASLGAEADRTDKPTDKLQRSLKRAAAEVENLTKQQNRQQAELQRTNGALRAAGVDTEKLGEAYSDLQGEFVGFTDRASEAAGAMQRTAKDGRAAAGSVTALDKAATAGKKSLGQIAKQLTIVSGAATAAIKGLMALSGAALFKGGIASAVSLEQALSEVRAVAGATAEEMAALKAAAEAGGASTRFSTLEAAQGLGELARATGSAKSAIATLPAALSLAQAAGLGVAESAQFITTTLTQYGLAAEHAGRVSDVLAQAANTTTADVQGLGNALSYAAPLANLLGLDLEKTAAIIGVMADEGFRGERAGTALRNVFSEMLDPTSTFAKALRDLGIESTDFVDVIEQLGTKGARGQEALMKLDAAARPAILALVNSGSKALRQLDGDLRNAAGSAEETARIMGDNLSGAAEQIKDTFDRTRRSLVEPLLEPLKEELLFLAQELEDFAASPEFEEIKLALVEMFGEGAAAARELIEGIDYSELATKIRAAVNEASGTIAEFRENVGTMVTALTLLNNTVSMLFNGLQAAVFLIASAVTQVVSLLAKLGDGFTGPYRKVAEFLGLIEKGQGSLAEFAGGMGAVSDEFADRFVKNVDEAWGATKRLAGAAEETSTAVAGVGTAAEQSVQSVTMLQEVVVSSSAALDAQGAAAAGAANATASAASRMEASSERLKKAFADMGIASQTELRRAAESAKANFELIRQAVSEGEASAEDARRAYAKYAEAARAAVADSDQSSRQRVEAELSVHEAVLGVGGAFDLAGDRAIEAGNKITNSASSAQQAWGGVAAAAAEAASNFSQLARGAGDVGKASEKAAEGVNKADYALQGLTDELVKAYFATNRYVSTVDTGIWSSAMNRITAQANAQADAIARLNAEMDKELAKHDPLAQAMEKLQAQYPYVQEAQLRATAEKQARLEDQKRRAVEEAQRLREEAQRAADAARQAQDDAAGTGGLAQPMEQVIRIEWTTPSRSVATAASAAEAEQVTRLARLLEPELARRLRQVADVGGLRRR